jgi:hypothetical protein
MAEALREVENMLDSGVRDADAPSATGVSFRRPSVMNRMSSQPPGAWLILVLALGSGSAGAGVSSLFGPSEAALTEIRKDIEANAARVGAVSTELEQTEEGMLREQITTQRWLGTQLIKQSTAITRIAAKIGVEVDAGVDPLLPGGPG